jgi:hypothetical protein
LARFPALDETVLLNQSLCAPDAAILEMESYNLEEEA